MISSEKLYVPLLVLMGSACATPPEDLAPTSEAPAALQESAPTESVITEEILAARAKMSASRRNLPRPSGGVSISSAETMLGALDIPAEFNPQVVSLVSPHEEATFDVPQWGAIRPQKGNSLMVLSTGQSNHPTLYSEPGVDFGGVGIAGDVSTFTISVDIPAGINRFSFDYNFLSAEYPDFIGSAFNDTFNVTVTDANGTRPALAAPVTVNSTIFQPASDSLVGGARFPFRLYVDNALGVDSAFDTGVIQDAGITGFQRAVVEVVEGPVTIQFDIRDLGDGQLDSAVILDNLSFVTVTAVDPVPIDDTNVNDPSRGFIEVPVGNELTHVTDDPARLIGPGRLVNAVAADGVSQIILRSSVPGPGAARFELAPGEERGKLSAISGGEPTWADSIDVQSVLHEGKYYAFALYQSPANFVRPGVPDDHNIDRRSVSMSMTHLPGEQGELRGDFTIEVVRRPVVVVHNAWSDCTIWTNGAFWKGSAQETNPIGIRNFLKIKCVRNYLPNKGLDYPGPSPATPEGNPTVVPVAINEILDEMRATNIAVTQVDLVAHGIGGLQARRYLETDGFKNRFNFHDGDVDRFITINTPHSGSRIACEAVAYRDFAKGNGDWTAPNPDNPAGPKGSLELAKMFIDNDNGDVIFDEIRLDSPKIAALRQIDVPSHAMVSSGGLTIPASIPLVATRPTAYQQATNVVLNTALVPLYTQMMKLSPRTRHLHPDVSAQHRSLYSINSLFFCAEGNCTAGDQHDFFAKVSEQRGGLVATQTTQAAVVMNDQLSSHMKVNISSPTSTRLRELLNAPLDAAFSAGFPAPVTSACPPVTQGTPPPPHGPLITEKQPGFGISAITNNLTILSPAPGTIVTPGTSIPVVVQGLNGFQSELTMVVGNGESVVGDDPANNTLQLSISADAIGTINISAMAFGTNGDMAFSQLVPLNVSVGATLNAIEIQGGDIAMRRPGSTTRLAVMGIYSDGIKRDLTAGQGTEYGVSNAGAQPFASVTNDGRVTALRPGSLTISARNGNRFTSVSVKVGFPACGDGVLDPGEECDDGNIVGGDACTATCELVNGLPDAVCSSPTVCTDPGLCSANVTTLGAGSTDPNNDPLTITQTPAGPYGVGDHDVTVRVSDGQSSDSCLSALDVNDCELPQLTCAGDFAVECTGAGGATITPPGAMASDNCGVQVEAPAAGHRNLGQHALAYAATDPSGNLATCQTQVTVQDTTAPSVTCPAPSVAECTGNGRAQVNPGIGSATDVCTVAQVTGPGAGSFPVGTTPLTYTATDLSGNQATCSTQVTVRDTQLPSITCPAPRVAECTGSGRATVDPGDATASDVCALASVTDPGPTSFPLGINAVTYTATDLGGNQATCSTQVTVRDTVKPVVTVAGATPLWPVDSNYRTVSLADCGIAVNDTCGGAVPPAIHQAQITCVTSDEPDDAPGSGDGDTANDIVIVNASTVRLRAEHAQSGDGRFYSIYFRVVDAAGNITRSMCPVRVVPQGCPAPTGGVTINQPGDCHADDSGGKFSVCR